MAYVHVGITGKTCQIIMDEQSNVGNIYIPKKLQISQRSFELVHFIHAKPTHLGWSS